MYLNIGENIKKLRKQKGVTQEELANYFNITSASVCKWERGETYPDISLICPLASYFDVTTDELFGYGQDKVNEHIQTIINNYWAAYRQSPTEATNIIKEAYKQYSNRVEIIHLYMWNKAGGYADNDNEVLKQNKDEFMMLSDKLISLSNDPYLINSAWNMKAKVFHALGDDSSALSIYDSKFPSFYQTVNQKKEQLYAKDTIEFKKYLKFNIYELTDFVLNKRMKEIWFDNLTLNDKINKTFNLIEGVEVMFDKYGYRDLVLAIHTLYKSFIEYLIRFNDQSNTKEIINEKLNKINTLAKDIIKEDDIFNEYITKLQVSFA